MAFRENCGDIRSGFMRYGRMVGTDVAIRISCVPELWEMGLQRCFTFNWMKMFQSLSLFQLNQLLRPLLWQQHQIKDQVHLKFLGIHSCLLKHHHPIPIRTNIHIVKESLASRKCSNQGKTETAFFVRAVLCNIDACMSLFCHCFFWLCKPSQGGRNVIDRLVIK